MRHCEKCGAPLEEHSRFCGRCGAPAAEKRETETICRNCGKKLEPGALFCPECGYRTNPEPEPEPQPQPEPEPNPRPEPEPRPKPDRTVPAPAPLSLGKLALQSLVPALLLCVICASIMASGSGYMDFPEAFFSLLLFEAMAWLVGMGMFLLARKYRRMAGETGDEKVRGTQDKSSRVLVVFGFLFAWVPPILITILVCA